VVFKDWDLTYILYNSYLTLYYCIYILSFETVVALGLGGPCAKYSEGPFPMWSTQKSSCPFHAKLL